MSASTSVEIIVFIQTARTVVVLICFLRWLLSLPPPHQLLSLSKVNRLLPLLIPMLMTSSSVIVAPKPCYPIDIESMALTKPSSSSVLTSRAMSLSSQETVDTAVQLLTGMTAEEYMKMIDPVLYHPNLFRDVVFLWKSPLCFPRSNGTTFHGCQNLGAGPSKWQNYRCI